MIERLEARRLLAFPAQALAFGDLGVISHSTDDIRNGFVEMPDDRFLGYGESRLAMYHPDGTLDTSFGGAGTRKLPFPVRDGDVTTDGKLMLIGAKLNDYTVSVARLNLDGSYDTTFAGDGRLALQFPGRPLIYKTSLFATEDGGAILVVSHFAADGQPGSEATSMFKLTAIGEFDPALTHKLFQGFHNDIEPIPGGDGAFYIGGKSTPFGGSYVARINATGAIDGGFKASALNPDPEPRALAIDDAGKVVVATGDFASLALLARLNTDGSLDKSFSGDGRIDLSQQGQDVPHDVDVADGKISLLYAFQPSGDKADRIYRFNDNGTPDTTFGDAGVFTGPFDFHGSSAMLVSDNAIIATSFNTIRSFDDSPDVMLENSILYVRGTSSDDTLAVGQGSEPLDTLVTFNGDTHLFEFVLPQQIKFLAQDGDDEFIATRAFPCVIDTGAGDDTITISDGNDTVRPGFGNDSIDTAGGDDEIDCSGGGIDTVSAGGGNDTIINVSGNIDAGDGDDRIRGGFFNGPVDGGAGNDDIRGGGTGHISGGDGNDTIASISGLADIDGGAGDDAIDVKNAGGAPDDFQDLPGTVIGGDGDDVISVASAEYTVDAGAGGDLIRCAGRFDVIHDPETLTTIDRSALHGGDGDDTIFSGPGIDSIYGGAGNDRIHSEEVNDFISAGGGNDVVFVANFGVAVNGGAGDDRVFAAYFGVHFIGGDGDDFINRARGAWGGRGNDTLHSDGGGEVTLIGGPGDDVFFSNDSAQGDTVDGGGGSDTATADDDDVLSSIENVL